MPDAELELVFEVNDLDLRPMFAELEKFSRKTVPEMIVERGGTMARYLAENTQPIVNEVGIAITNDNTAQGQLDGGSLRARDLGRSAVRRDLRRVYVSPTAVFGTLQNLPMPGGKGGKNTLARAFYSALKKNDFAQARALLLSAGIAAARLDVVPWDAGARHRRLRNARGRVNKSNRPQVVSDAKPLKAYMKQEQDRVGWTKAGWVNAGRQITDRGMSKIRQWIKKHSAAPGIGLNLTRNTDFPRVVLTNAVQWADQAISQKQFTRAESALVESLRRELEITLAKLAEKENRRRPVAA